MKCLRKFLLLIIVTCIPLSQMALDQVITFFLQKYPYVKSTSHDPEFLKRYSKKVQQPGYLSNQIIKSHRTNSGVPGVMCLYGGRVALSDSNGQIIFPRLPQSVPKTYFLITTGIQPAYMIAPATVHNWMIDPKHDSQMYLVQLKQDDQTKLYYFETSQVALPKDNNIPLNTIIIIGNPEEIFIPTGATFTDYSPNLTLPPVYIKKEFCFVYNSFYTLAIKQYFAQTESNFQQEDLTVSMIQQPKL
ncbi:MAG TPA: hypothetical protein VLG50_06285 [Candidatus Saccharimonadales bacterium]|nr:hypothetical protein [Candidatus Saccharimonadales bacterium]